MTLGCKVNQYETQAIEGILRERGHETVTLGDGCNVCILNTCAVTAESERKSRQLIRKMKKLEPDAMIAVCGCYSQLDPKELENLDVDLIGGVYNRTKFAQKICNSDKTIDLSSQCIIEELPPGGTTNRTRALLKIQDGCDNFCTYCIVPYIRGRSRSLPLERVAEYTKQLEEQGYKEIVITGIEISSYGKDFNKTGDGSLSYSTEKIRQRTVPCLTDEPSPCLTNLITAIKTISFTAPNTRLRLGSLDPAILTEEVCQKLSEIPNLCNHFHLSLQSGCNATLRRMGRKYTTKQVLNNIQSIRKYFTDCGITADLITGFPGETEDEFNQTLEFIKSAAFSDMHIFPYSLRPGTKAAKMPGQIDKSIKKERARVAIEAASEMAKKFKRAQIGKTVEVLFEQFKNGFSTGHSGNYLEISVSEDIERNTIQNIKITDLKNGRLTGKLFTK